MKKLIFILIAFFISSLSANEQKRLELKFNTFVKKFCIDCHGPKKQKGKLRLDTLKLDFSDVENLEKWHAVSEAVEIRDMPPKKKAQPGNYERKTIVKGINSVLKSAHLQGVIASGERSLRQLTRVQMRNTLRDLLGVDMTFRDPTKNYPSGEVRGEFDTITTENKISGHQMNSSLEIAEKSL